MSRNLLGAVMYIEDVLQKENPTEDEKQKVQKYLEDVKSFQTMRKVEKKAKSASKMEEIENGVQLLIEFAGFEEIDPPALQKLKELFMYKFITMARQMATAERRKRDGLQIPYKSALEWTLKLNGVQTVLDLKTWYDQVYLARFQRLKEQMINDK